MTCGFANAEGADDCYHCGASLNLVSVPTAPPVPSAQAVSEAEAIGGKPRLFFYSILFPLIWYFLALVMAAVFPGKRLNVLGICLVVGLTVFIICQHFIGFFKRQMKIGEKWRLSFYCFFWAILLEFLALNYQIRMHPNLFSVGFLRMILLWMIGVAADGLIISAGVFLLSEGIIRHSLRKREKA